MNECASDLSALDRAIEVLDSRGARASADELNKARKQIAQLIEADTEYDAALTALSDLNRKIAERGWMDIEHKALRHAGERLARAQHIRWVALRQLRGGA